MIHFFLMKEYIGFLFLSEWFTKDLSQDIVWNTGGQIPWEKRVKMHMLESEWFPGSHLRFLRWW